MNSNPIDANGDGVNTVPIPIGVRRRRWRTFATGFLVAAALAAATVAALIVGEHRSGAPAAAKPETEALQQWWADGHGDVEALEGIISDAQHGLAINDPVVVATACQRMHDAGVLALKARLPAPDSELTADLRGAIEDAHAASHMCLAAEAGTSTNYAGEFRSNMEQAERQLKAAQSLVNEKLSKA